MKNRKPINGAQVSRRTLPSNDRVREAMVEAAAAKLGAARVGRRLWLVDGREIGTARMVQFAEMSQAKGAEAW